MGNQSFRRGMKMKKTKKKKAPSQQNSNLNPEKDDETHGDNADEDQEQEHQSEGEGEGEGEGEDDEEFYQEEEGENENDHENEEDESHMKDYDQIQHISDIVADDDAIGVEKSSDFIINKDNEPSLDLNEEEPEGHQLPSEKTKRAILKEAKSNNGEDVNQSFDPKCHEFP